ncbi:hypothetical protein QL285_030949 [Trifolium repens]|nr:hypothetical protein QL285_030949 [Trifolium repens]
MTSCIILHNMIVEDEQDFYSQHWTDFEQSEESGSSAPQQPYSTEVLPAFANHEKASSMMDQAKSAAQSAQQSLQETGQQMQAKAQETADAAKDSTNKS